MDFTIENNSGQGKNTTQQESLIQHNKVGG